MWRMTEQVQGRGSCLSCGDIEVRKILARVREGTRPRPPIAGRGVSGTQKRKRKSACKGKNPQIPRSGPTPLLWAQRGLPLAPHLFSFPFFSLYNTLSFPLSFPGKIPGIPRGEPVYTWKLPCARLSILTQTGSKTQGNSRVSRMEHLPAPSVPWKFPETQSAGDPLSSVFLFVCRKTWYRPSHAARAASQPPQQQPLPHPLRRIPPNPFPGSTQAEDVHGLPHGEPRVLFSCTRLGRGCIPPTCSRRRPPASSTSPRTPRALKDSRKKKN